MADKFYARATNVKDGHMNLPNDRYFSLLSLFFFFFFFVKQIV